MQRKTVVAAAGLAAALWLAPLPLRGGERLPDRVSVRLDLGRVGFPAAGFGGGWRWGVGFLFRTGRRAGIEVAVGRFTVPVEAEAGGEASLPAGRMQVTALDFSQLVFLGGHGRLRPFAIIGVGFHFIGFAAAAPEKELVDHLSLLWGGGIECRLSSRLAVLARARCDMIRTWAADLPRSEPIRELAAADPRIIRLYGLDLALGLRLAL